MDRSEQFIASAKTGLTKVRSSLTSNPSGWRNCASAVRTCITYIDESRIMFSGSRIDERLWLINEVQRFTYFDADMGGLTEFASWCEREWNRVLATDPYNVGAFKGLGQAWLSKAQYWLAKIHQEEDSHSIGEDEDDLSSERRRHTANYVEARAVLMPAVDFFHRAVQNAQNQRCLTGELLVLRAEACMSLGNVSHMRTSQKFFKDALLALKAAERLPGYRLPAHLMQYLKDNEYILSC